jgi:hypothetical protein
MHTFCTIITSSHIGFAKTLLQSLRHFDTKATLQVLITDAPAATVPEQDGLALYTIQQLRQLEIVQLISQKYAHSNRNHFRWALKPVFMCFLLENEFNKVIYCDPDLFFTDNYSFLIEELNATNVLLSPHWRNTDPLMNEENFFALFKDGLYNAGFIASNRQGLSALQWWASVCHYKMEQKAEKGLYDDQRYLDVLPLMFEKVKPLSHKGCNLAHWNMDECKRTIQENTVRINETFPVVFIHFTPETINEIENGRDGLLRPFLKSYREACQENGAPLSPDATPSENLLTTLKRKTLLRTRLKRWLFRLAEKL